MFPFNLECSGSLALGPGPHSPAALGLPCEDHIVSAAPAALHFVLGKFSVGVEIATCMSPEPGCACRGKIPGPWMKALDPPDSVWPGCWVPPRRPSLTLSSQLSQRGELVCRVPGAEENRRLQEPRVGLWQHRLCFLPACLLCIGTETLAFVLTSGLKGASFFPCDENGAVRLLLESPDKVKFTG